MKADTIKIEKKIKSLGYDVRVQFAQTGTTYFHCVHQATGIKIKVRVADHAEAYPPLKGERCIDVSESGTTIKSMLEMLIKPANIEAGTAIAIGGFLYNDDEHYKSQMEAKRLERKLNPPPAWHKEIREARQAWVDAGRLDWTSEDFEASGFRKKIAKAMISRRYGNQKIRFKSKCRGHFKVFIGNKISC